MQAWKQITFNYGIFNRNSSIKWQLPLVLHSCYRRVWNKAIKGKKFFKKFQMLKIEFWLGSFLDVDMVTKGLAFILKQAN